MSLIHKNGMDNKLKDFFPSTGYYIIGTRRVHANQVYQEYISDRNHLHMNATQVTYYYWYLWYYSMYSSTNKVIALIILFTCTTRYLEHLHGKLHIPSVQHYWEIQYIPCIKLIRNYIRPPSGIFSISSLVKISMTSFSALYGSK